MHNGQRLIAFDTVAVHEHDGTAIEIADATTQGADSRHQTLRVLAIWKHVPDGSWRLDADIFV